MVYPRSSWWVRLGIALLNLTQRLRRNDFRVFAYPTETVEAVIRGRGLARVYHRHAGMWQVAVYERPA